MPTKKEPFDFLLPIQAQACGSAMDFLFRLAPVFSKKIASFKCSSFWFPRAHLHSINHVTRVDRDVGHRVKSFALWWIRCCHSRQSCKSHWHNMHVESLIDTLVRSTYCSVWTGNLSLRFLSISIYRYTYIIRSISFVIFDEGHRHPAPVVLALAARADWLACLTELSWALSGLPCQILVNPIIKSHQGPRQKGSDPAH